MTSLDIQIGGSHYSKMKIQPVEFIHINNFSFLQGAIIKYVTRYKDKNGIEDLKKAIHCLEILIDYETRGKTEIGTKVGQAFKEADRHL